VGCRFPTLLNTIHYITANPAQARSSTRRFGKGADAEFVDLARRYSNVCGDVSLRLPEVAEGRVAPERMVAPLRAIGTGRVRYGSNFCLNETLHPDPKGPEAADFQRSQTLAGPEMLATLPLTEDERADIAGRNFRRWVGVDDGFGSH
jgi:hypothetical protein